MGAPSINETLDLVRKAQATPLPDDILKAFVQSGSATTGLTAYDLEAPAKTLYPVLTPIRNMLPRVSAKGGIQANWKAITGVNTTAIRPGVSEGNRGAVISHTTADYLAAYVALGLEDYVTFEADFAAEFFDDAKARAVEGLLRATMISEEGVIVGGNRSVNLGTTPTPTLAASTSGGTLATATYSVICVALSYDAYWQLAGYNNGATGQNVVLGTAALAPIGSFTRTNADGSTDVITGGVARKSTNATVSVTGPTGSIGASVTAVPGAFAYAWYWGAAASETLGAITTINSVSITATATGVELASALPATDNSISSLEFDGLLYLALKSQSGAYFKALATGTPGTGTFLTSDGAGGISEIDAMFQDRWNQYRLGFSRLYVNSQELLNMNKKVIANGGAPLYRYNLDGNKPDPTIEAGVVIGSYLNKIMNQKVQIMVHPNVPPGTILGMADQVPYKLSGVNNIAQMRLRRDYYQIEWPRRSRKYEYGVYMDGVLQHFFPPALGIITNIANG